MNTAQFEVNRSACTGCGACLAVCPGNMVGGNVLHMENGVPVMTNQANFGWRGCWRCQHCMAVCPTGAISVLGVSAQEAPARPDPSVAQELPRLVAFRRACRAFKPDDVDEATIERLLDAMGNVPTGGNSFGLQFSVVETRNGMARLYHAVFPHDPMSLFSPQEDLGKLALYGAPHLFLAHKVVGNRFHEGDLTELGVATAYFELLANASGLGTVISNYAADQIMNSAEARRLLGIPDDHSALAVVGFGYPRIEYARSVRKHKRITRLK